MTLSQLLGQPEADQATAAWIAANGTPAPPGTDCDASIAPIVTGTIDQDLLAQLAARVYPVSSATGAPGGTDAAHAAVQHPAADHTAVHQADLDAADQTDVHQTAADLDATEGAASMAGRAAQQLLVADAAAVLSGPRGLAAWLRTSLVTGPAASVSLPLDLGKPTETVPAWLRKAIAVRDKHCGFPGCDVPPEYCHVHHIIPRAEGGTTSLQNCILGCGFHHLIVIHRWGWQLTLSADGTTTAVHPPGLAHAPQPRATNSGLAPALGPGTVHPDQDLQLECARRSRLRSASAALGLTPGNRNAASLTLMADMDGGAASAHGRDLPDDSAAAELIPLWCLPIFGDKIRQVPGFLVPRLTEMANELPGTDFDRRIYYERVHALLAVASISRGKDRAGFNLDEPPSNSEKRFGAILGQALHQGCSLADVAFAARLQPEHIIAVGKRTIRRTNWLKRIYVNRGPIGLSSAPQRAT